MRDVGGENGTATTSWDGARLVEMTWTKAVVLRVAGVVLLMLLILLGNVVVVVTIASRAELRHKHVNVFILDRSID